MSITVLAFAQSQDLFGFASRSVPVEPGDTPRRLLLRLRPEAKLGMFRVAVDGEFAEWDTPLDGAGELAIIPPVSGG